MKGTLAHQVIPSPFVRSTDEGPEESVMDERVEARVDAMDRSNGAGEEQQRCTEQHDAARGSAGELSALAKRRAEGQFSAREA